VSKPRLVSLANWARTHLPTRDSLEQSAIMRPFAHLVLRADLWRFNRRSVPRGVAVGLLVGIFALIPGVQLVGAALLCVPTRGNIPLAGAMTFLSNPATTPFIMLAAIALGNALGFHADLATLNHLFTSGAGVAAWMHWLLSDGAPALMVGLVIIALVAAALGYAIAALVWRHMVSTRRRKRRSRV
jgi:uncharacterized protein (DUF2062 family)